METFLITISLEHPKSGQEESILQYEVKVNGPFLGGAEDIIIDLNERITNKVISDMSYLVIHNTNQ